MIAKGLTPILNVSDIEQSSIFLCLNGPGGDEATDKGVWMSIWVDDVDAVHRRCVEQGLEVTWPPTNTPWGVREMHVRRPDGHVFRVSRGIEDAE